MYVNKVEDIPTGAHWAILRSSAIHIPADERSKTNPGHGYPERNEPYITYQVFTSEDEFRTALAIILNGKYGDKTAKGIHVTATYSGRVTVAIEDD